MNKITAADTITIFGGNGFLGSYLVRELARTDARIIIVYNSGEEHNQALRICGAVGQISFIKADVTTSQKLEEILKESTYVINLIGILYQTKKHTFQDIHVKAAENIAKLAKQSGVKRLVHISALGVDKNMHSLYAKTKLSGEKAVLKAFPKATIIRPSIIFGAEDNFINRFARLAKFSPALPLIGGGHTKLQPVYVADVAKAIANCLMFASTAVAGKIFELGGPQQYTFRAIMEYILHITKRTRLLVNIPYPIAKLQAIFLELLPQPLLTRDQVELLKTDNIVNKQNGLEILNIKPTPMEALYKTDKLV